MQCVVGGLQREMQSNQNDHTGEMLIRVRAALLASGLAVAWGDRGQTRSRKAAISLWLRGERDVLVSSAQWGLLLHTWSLFTPCR